MRQWWNWNTQRSLKPPSLAENCGFESHLPHHDCLDVHCSLPKLSALGLFPVTFARNVPVGRLAFRTDFRLVRVALLTWNPDVLAPFALITLQCDFRHIREYTPKVY